MRSHFWKFVATFFTIADKPGEIFLILVYSPSLYLVNHCYYSVISQGKREIVGLVLAFEISRVYTYTVCPTYFILSFKFFFVNSLLGWNFNDVLGSAVSRYFFVPYRS